MKSPMSMVVCLVSILSVVSVLAPTAAYCGTPAKNELTLSASFFNPNEGPMVWNADAEVLVPVGQYFILGPSLSMFDLGDTDGNSLGAALEFNAMKGNGLFFGAAAHYPSGDLKDAVDYTYEGRVGVKLGQEHWFAKLYASRLWSKAVDGSTIDPDGTRFQVGIGARF